jgi:hypothetical protein
MVGRRKKSKFFIVSSVKNLLHEDCQLVNDSYRGSVNLLKKERWLLAGLFSNGGYMNPQAGAMAAEWFVVP